MYTTELLNSFSDLYPDCSTHTTKLPKKCTEYFSVCLKTNKNPIMLMMSIVHHLDYFFRIIILILFSLLLLFCDLTTSKLVEK